METYKFTKIVVYCLNFFFLAVIVILINDFNGSYFVSKLYENEHLLYLYFSSIFGFFGLQFNSEIAMFLFIFVNSIALLSTYRILCFYFVSSISYFVKEDMMLKIAKINHYGIDFDFMESYQTNLKCCGLYSLNEYARNLPKSCCLKLIDGKCIENNAFLRGCWPTYSEKYYFYKDLNFFLELFVLLSQIFSIFFALIFIRELSKRINEKSYNNFTTIRQ